MRKLGKKDIPNALTISRIILAPLSLIFIFQYPSPSNFFIYLLLVHLTDILDGYFARKFNAVSHFGRKLDSYADYILSICLVIGVWVFMKDDLLTNKLYLVTIVATIFIPALVALIKLKHLPQLHLNTNKVNATVAAIFIFMTLFIQFSPTIYLISTIFFIIAGIDRVIFYLLLKDEEDMKILSSWELVKNQT